MNVIIGNLMCHFIVKVRQATVEQNQILANASIDLEQ